jgi:hypothetical protein
MSLSDLPRITRRLEAVEDLAKKLNDTMTNVINDIAAHEAKAADDYKAFVSGINSNMGGSVASAIDVSKARIVEELKLYIDDAIARTVASIDQKIAALESA